MGWFIDNVVKVVKWVFSVPGLLVLTISGFIIYLGWRATRGEKNDLGTEWLDYPSLVEQNTEIKFKVTNIQTLKANGPVAGAINITNIAGATLTFSLSPSANAAFEGSITVVTDANGVATVTIYGVENSDATTISVSGAVKKPYGGVEQVSQTGASFQTQPR
jgi:hypothetical protein